MLWEATYALNQLPIYGIVFPTARIHKSTTQGIEEGMTSLIIYYTWYSVSETLCSASLDNLESKEGMLPLGEATIIH